jgi:hypothetical protein
LLILLAPFEPTDTDDDMDDIFEQTDDVVMLDLLKRADDTRGK